MNMGETSLLDWRIDEFRVGRLLGNGAWLEEVGTGDAPLLPGHRVWLSVTCLTAMEPLRGLKLGARVTMPPFKCPSGVFSKQQRAVQHTT
jgi:hypothetical protein